MSRQTKASGVILAGGLARRMNKQDKGLIRYKGRPMIAYAVEAMAPVVGQLMINANRNNEQYEKFGYPVIADQTDTFDGPLAGVLTALKHCGADELLVMPCDSPLVKPDDLFRLLDALRLSGAEIAVAFDGERLHPVFLALKATLEPSLQAYLKSGQRKIDRWFEQLQMTTVDFSDTPDIFLNINTLEELVRLESGSHE